MQTDDTFIGKVAQYITKNYDLKNEGLTVVFPNKRAAYYLRDKLKNLVSETVWLPKIMSIEEVVSQWSGYELADKLDVTFELVAIENDFNKDANTNILQFGGKAAQMATDFDDIDNYMVNAQDLFNYVTSEKKIGTWDVDEMLPNEKESAYLRFYESLINYYTRLREHLMSKKKGYYGMLSRILAETFTDEQLISTVGGDKVVFAGFNALTKSEEIVIDRLVKLGMASTLWDFDSYYVDDVENEAGTFARMLRKEHANWFDNDFGLSNNMLTRQRTINIIDASGNTLQAKALQEQLSKSTRNKEAIVLVNEDMLIPVLNSIPEPGNGNVETKIKISMGYPISLTPINGLTSLYFKMHRHRFVSDPLYIWPVFEIFNLDIVKLAFNRTELKTMTDWRNKKIRDSQYTVSVDNIGLDKDSDIERLIILMTSPVSTIVDLLDNLKKVIVLFGKKVVKNTSPEAVFLRAQTNEVYKSISRIEKIIQEHSNFINDNETVETLYKIVARENSIKLTSENDIGNADKKYREIQVMGLLETRNLDFDTVHLLNVNEGMLPQKISQGSFIPYFIRCNKGMPSNEKKQSVFAYHFYRLLQNCSNINIYYNSDKDSDNDKSRFLMQIEKELVSKPNVATKLNISHFVNKNAPADTLVSPITINKTDSVMQKLKQKFKISMAPSSLQQYVSCPLKFCLKYVYDISDNNVDENFQANVIGEQVHDILKKLLFDNHKCQIIDNNLLDTIKSEAKTLLQSINLPQNAFNLLNETVINSYVRNYLNNEKGGFATIGAETKLNHVINVNGIECNIEGKIDRIDRLSDGTIRIADYKTDRKIEKKDTTVSEEINKFEDIPEKARQLLVYKYLYLKNNKDTTHDKISASIIRLTHHSDLYLDLLVKNSKLNDDFEKTMEDLLVEFLSDILDSQKPFVQDLKNKKCNYCDYKRICVQEVKNFW